MNPIDSFDPAETVQALSQLILCMALESIASIAAEERMAWPDAYDLAARTTRDAVEKLLAENLHPAALKDQLCTPDSICIEALRALESTRLRASITSSCQAANERVKQFIISKSECEKQ